MRLDSGTLDFIESQRVARLATVDSGGQPHIVPICFALDGSTLYTPIDEKPKRGDFSSLQRLRNIAANPSVQVLLDRYDDDWQQLRYVQLRGRALVFDSGDEHVRAIALLRARYPQYATMDLDSRPIIAVRIERIAEWRYSTQKA